MQCANNVKQIVLAIHGIVEANGVFPPLAVGTGGYQDHRRRRPLQGGCRVYALQLAIAVYRERIALRAGTILTCGQ